MTCLGQYIDLYKNAVNDSKMLSMWLQAWVWHKSHALPTDTEQRFMNFESLLHGVKYLLYFNAGNSDQAYYDRLFKHVREVQGMEQVLSEGSVIQGFRAEGKTILSRGKSWNGKQYFIVLNQSAEPCTVRFHGLPEKIFDLKNVKPFSVEKPLTLPPFETLLLSDDSKLPEGAYPVAEYNAELEKYVHDFYGKDRQKVLEKFGEAHWIWFPGEEMKPDNTIQATFEFQLKTLPDSAVWRLIADDSFHAFINGQTDVFHKNPSAANLQIPLVKQENCAIFIRKQKDWRNDSSQISTTAF